MNSVLKVAICVAIAASVTGCKRSPHRAYRRHAEQYRAASAAIQAALVPEELPPLPQFHLEDIPEPYVALSRQDSAYIYQRDGEILKVGFLIETYSFGDRCYHLVHHPSGELSTADAELGFCGRMRDVEPLGDGWWIELSDF